MFKLTPDTEFTWPVVADIPADGKHQKLEFHATFKVMSQAEIDNLMSDDDDPTNAALSVLREALISFSGLEVEDAAGQPVTDREERRNLLFLKPFLIRAVSNAYAEGIQGRRSKN